MRMSPLLKEAIELGAAAVEVAGLLTALHAVARARTPQGSLAWALALAVLPWIALPLYLIFGRSRFQGYIEARRRGNSEIGHLFEEVQAGLRPYLRDAGADQADESDFDGV